jgi:rhomboid protease GluP
VEYIILTCFALYVLSMALDIPGALRIGGLFSTLAPTSASLYKLGMGGLVSWQAGRWWSLLTANYLHGSILHILFNMLWLRQIGPLVEELFGASRFLVIYTVAGLLGSIFSTLAGTPFFIGASGAVFGLFGALIAYGLRRGGTFGTGLFRQMALWAAIGFVLGLLMPNTDNWGHLGGLVAGLVLGALLGYQERTRQKLIHHIAALAALVLIVACFTLMVIAFFRGG